MKLSAPFAASISKRPWSPVVSSDHVTPCPSGSVATNLPTSVPLFSTMLKAPTPLRRLTNGGSFSGPTVTVTAMLPVSPSLSRALTVMS